MIMATDLVVEVVLLGIPDPLSGNKLVALIVPTKSELRCDDFRHICRKKLPSYKVPQDVYFCSCLPKSASGKIDRKQCLEKIYLDLDESI